MNDAQMGRGRKTLSREQNIDGSFSNYDGRTAYSVKTQHAGAHRPVKISRGVVQRLASGRVRISCSGGRGV